MTKSVSKTSQCQRQVSVKDKSVSKTSQCQRQVSVKDKSVSKTSQCQRQVSVKEKSVSKTSQCQRQNLLNCKSYNVRLLIFLLLFLKFSLYIFLSPYLEFVVKKWLIRQVVSLEDNFVVFYYLYAFEIWPNERDWMGTTVQLVVIKFASELRQIDRFLHVLWLPPPINLTEYILWKCC
jgi:hypothetical protein